MSDTAELIERLRKGDAMNGRLVNCKLDLCNCSLMEDAASRLSALQAENDRLKRALAVAEKVEEARAGGRSHEDQLLISDLTMLAWKLVRRLQRQQDGSGIAEKARDFLNRKGLNGSILRAHLDAEDAEAKP